MSSSYAYKDLQCMTCRTHGSMLESTKENASCGTWNLLCYRTRLTEGFPFGREGGGASKTVNVATEEIRPASSAQRVDPDRLRDKRFFFLSASVGGVAGPGPEPIAAASLSSPMGLLVPVPDLP